MKKTIEIKSMSKEAAVKRALKILDAVEENVVSIQEKVKSRSFFGLFNKEGIYDITIDTEQKKSTINKEVIKTEATKEIKKEVKIENISEDRKLEAQPNKYSEKEDKSEFILEKVQKIIDLMDLTLTATVSKGEGTVYNVNLFGEEKGIIIGKKGKTLMALENILNCIIRGCRIEVNVEDFKEKRNETLREVARKMSEKALATGKTIRLNSMPAKERKIIHEVVNTYSELDTFSEGKEPKRYIVIKRKK
jgi:spoIIIJ-associated protein